MNLLVLGYGNELRGDDALGLHFASAAQELGWPAFPCRHLTPELAEVLRDYESVLFVDATRNDEAVCWQAVPEQGDLWPLHAGSPAALLALTRSLYGRAPEGWLLSLPGEEFGFSTGLSRCAEKSLAQGLELFRHWGDRRKKRN